MNEIKSLEQKNIMKNQNLIVGTLFLCAFIAVTIASPRPRPDEEHYFDKEV